MKTTIDIPEELWQKFSIKVMKEYGFRYSKNKIIINLIESYLKSDSLTG